MRRYVPAACALAASLTVLVAALAGPVRPAAAGSPAPQLTPSCPTLAEWNSETHDGSHPAPVPDVMGMTRDDAVAALARSGFDATTAPRGAAGDWTVTDQTPTGEEQADCGSTVALDLEEPAAEVTGVEVPDVAGDPLDQAEQELRDLGLVTSVAEGDAADPRVVAAQDPAAGSRVPAGSTVTLRLVPPAPVSPTVTGPTDPESPDVTPGGTEESPTVTEPADQESPGETEESPQVSQIDPVETGSSGSVLPLALVAALVAAGVLVWALRRPGRGRRRMRPPATPSVVCVPRADLTPHVELRELTPSLRFELVCHHDRGRQEIREIVR